MREKGKEPKDDRWKAKYKEPVAPETEGLHRLPEGWVWASMDQVTARSEYGTSKKCSYSSANMAVLRIPNIVEGKVDTSDLKFVVDPIEVDQSDALQVGDVLVCRTNGSISLVGKAAVVTTPFERPHYFASYLLRFRLAETTILPRWLHTYISSQAGRRFIEMHAASSAGQNNISLSTIHSMQVPIPPSGEQQRIVAEVERRLSVAEHLENAVDRTVVRVEQLRQAVLVRAFEGKLAAQDPSDEPADVLLERVRAERARRPSTGRRRSRRSRSAEAKAAQMRLEEARTE